MYFYIAFYSPGESNWNYFYFIFQFSHFGFSILHQKETEHGGTWGVDLDLDDVDVLLGFNP